MVDQKTLEAFQMMWGPFPERVMLVHKNRNILAVNESARAAEATAGIKCFTLNPTGVPGEYCKHCKANIALHEGRAVVSHEDGNKVLAYWIPLKDVEDVYVHFAIRTAR
jgi:hypothetical protein